MIIENVDVRKKVIIYRYTVQGTWKKFFNTKSDFFIEYSENISGTPKSIAIIPFLCNFLPIAWVFDAEIIVSELDKNFYDNLDEVKRGYMKMYPQINFGGKLTVENLIDNDYEVSEKTATFFSGGVDAFNTLISHAEENPTLITLFGSDVKLNDIKGWNNVKAHALYTAENFHCKNLFIRSSFRYVINERVLTQFSGLLSGDNWWHGFQHGIAIIGHAAPYVYLHKIAKLYIASTNSANYGLPYTCASDITIDNYVKIGKCVTIHDGYDFNRQEKVRRICEYKKDTGVKIDLRVCWKSRGGKNCCQCEKCYRTILEIIAEGENPTEMGFENFTANLNKMKADLQNPRFFGKSKFLAPKYYKVIQDRFREKPDNLRKFKLSWFMKLNFSNKTMPGRKR